ncbi:relaxase domain-containing protein [Actinomadura roseirufa]|uniref:relaxase domain-containing protein n=1 Tax=Actinomadura roseirufa TaxID=2094049 RepID=UPI0010413760|nr:relaxase domain-containing protein [Actinomadura roseirufa]
MPEEMSTVADIAARLLDPSFSPQAFTPQGADSGVRANSMWHGSDEALRKAGLRAGTAVRTRDLTAVLSGRHVRTGAPIIPAGEVFDLTFKAPNSLSLLWSRLAPGPRADVEEAVLDCAARMLTRLTADNPVINGIRPARSLVASLVLHAVGTLSAANGAIPPMLHVHSLLFAVLDETGTLTLPDEATLYNGETLAQCDAFGEGELAQRMVELGYSVVRTPGNAEHSFEMAGVPQELLDDHEFWQNTGCAVASFG